MKRKAVVAMSGGVDSSVAAALMKQDGYDVTGIMLKLWEGAAANNESGCCSLDAAEDARRVSQILDIPFYVLNFADQFKATVVANFTSRYAAGLTPNPCIECNRSVKFATLLRKARSFGADVLATGHYARVDEAAGMYRLRRGVDQSKDQSYVLYMLGQDELSAARFPVGHYSKPDIRAVASELGLKNALKKDSQEICFVPHGDTHRFISEQVPEGSLPGPILDAEGTRVGTHRGFAHYTIGQRRGTGVAAKVPVYVKHIRPVDNTIVVATRQQLWEQEFEVEGLNFVKGPGGEAFRAAVMTRYRGPESDATISVEGDRAKVVFDRPQPPTAPGQAAVFYEGDLVLGGGTIRRVA